MKLPPLITQLNSNSARGKKDRYYDKLFDCLNSCITLSCSQKGIDSLLCSVFFDPEVPCNLVGAHLLGIAKAIESVKSNNPRAFANLMIKRCPNISPLWLAAIWSGQASGILACAMGGLPPISLPVASWTETLQSFLQIGYHSPTNRPCFISRACEYSVSYFVHPNFVAPFTPSPPFGETTIPNTSLEVQKHLPHNHQALQHQTYWILANGDELPAPQPPKNMPPRLSVRLPPITHSALIGRPELK